MKYLVNIYRLTKKLTYLTGVMHTDKQTEEKIFEAAKTVFQKNGFSGARMQSIADEAGINKAMLHYYFRSKDQLFHEVFKEGVRALFPRVLSILNAELPFGRKVEKLVDTYFTLIRDNPHLPSFIIHEMNQHTERFREFILKEGIRPPERFIRQINDEIKQGRMRPVDPRDLLVNILSLILFPVLAKPMIQTVFQMDESVYSDFLNRRRDQLPKMIMDSVKPSKT